MSPKENEQETRFPDVFGLTPSEAVRLLQIARTELPEQLKKLQLSDPFYPKHGSERSFVAENIAFSIWQHESLSHIWEGIDYSVSEERALQLYNVEMERIANWPPMKRILMDEYSSRVTIFITGNAHSGKFYYDVSGLSVLLIDLTGKQYFASELFDYIIFRLKIYIYELETDLDASKKRGKYRKPEDRPRPDLPSNHYENLTARPLGIRASDALRNAVDQAASRESTSRNEWVKAAMEEKLLRDHPDLLMRNTAEPSAYKPK